MKTKIKIIFTLLILVLLATGCKKENKNPIHGNEPAIPVESPIGEPIEEDVEVIEDTPIKEGIPSPLSGIYASEEKVNRRVVAVMFDNHPGARWQAGLKDAEIVYEFPVEAPYTRYIGMYLINDPELLGSIRSARPYFVTKALEYDAIYVRVGGSDEAKDDVKSLKIADIDGLTSSNKVFWRVNHKKMPHNLYTSMEVIRKTAEERNYKNTGDFEGFKFNEEDLSLEGYNANGIKINYGNNNTTEYNFHEEEKIYLRKKDGKDHLDESDKSVIFAKNIIIQEVNAKVIDNEGRLSIDLIGEGKGKFFANGKGIDITWVKKDRKSRTIYYKEDGQELLLNPGITWIQVVKRNTSIIIE